MPILADALEYLPIPKKSSILTFSSKFFNSSIVPYTLMKIFNKYFLEKNRHGIYRSILNLLFMSTTYVFTLKIGIDRNVLKIFQDLKISFDNFKQDIDLYIDLSYIEYIQKFRMVNLLHIEKVSYSRRFPEVTEFSTNAMNIYISGSDFEINAPPEKFIIRTEKKINSLRCFSPMFFFPDVEVVREKYSMYEYKREILPSLCYCRDFVVNDINDDIAEIEIQNFSLISKDSLGISEKPIMDTLRKCNIKKLTLKYMFIKHGTEHFPGKECIFDSCFYINLGDQKTINCVEDVREFMNMPRFYDED